MQPEWMNRMALPGLWLIAAATAMAMPAHAEDVANEVSPMKVQKEKASYALGVEIARTFRRQGVDVDADLVVKGMKEALQGEKLQMSEEELLKTLNLMTAELRGKQARSRLATALDNKKQGEDFLAANRTKEGVITLPSGLQYLVVQAGNGARATENDTVECRYRGTLIDGTEVDSTYKVGEMITLSLSDPNIISGLKEALKLMPAGSTWRLFIPYYLAYTSQGSGRIIGPNATLIYDIELLSVGGSGPKTGATAGTEIPQAVAEATGTEER